MSESEAWEWFAAMLACKESREAYANYHHGYWLCAMTLWATNYMMLDERTALRMRQRVRRALPKGRDELADSRQWRIRVRYCERFARESAT